MGFVQEFRDFARKGNMLDMAIGIILGAAFSKIVTSLVNDILMPPIGLMLGGVEFKDLQFILKEAEVLATGDEVAVVAIRYGQFVNTLIEFLIVAMSVFFVVKAMNRVIQMREERRRPVEEG
jgi:large conductance mechanosensitive channel